MDNLGGTHPRNGTDMLQDLGRCWQVQHKEDFDANKGICSNFWCSHFPPWKCNDRGKTKAKIEFGTYLTGNGPTWLERITNTGSLRSLLKMGNPEQCLACPMKHPCRTQYALDQDLFHCALTVDNALAPTGEWEDCTSKVAYLGSPQVVKQFAQTICTYLSSPVLEQCWKKKAYVRCYLEFH